MAASHSSVGQAQQVHSIGDLIRAPIEALMEAQIFSARSTLEFISEVGFEQGGSEGQPKAKTLKFTYTHPVPDPQNPGSTIDTPTTVTVPLLAMLQLPNLGIAESTIDFNLKIVGVEPAKKKRSDLQLPISVNSIYASRKVSPSGETEPHSLAISIKMKRDEPSEAQKRIQNLLQESITAHPVESKAKPAPAPATPGRIRGERLRRPPTQ